MKKLILIIILLLFSSNIFLAQFQWHTQCTRRPLTSINFISPSNARIFGGDILYKSSDGGSLWSYPLSQSPPIGTIPVYGWHTPSVIYFLDSLRGWACQYSNTILKTTNGGNTWTTINTGISSVTFQTIFFVNNNTGWVGGYSYYPQTNIFKTTNGGFNWTSQSSNSIREITSICMINDLKGFYCAGWNDSIGYTNDGGLNWSRKKVGNGQGTREITFFDPLHGWVLGYGYPNYVSRTTDGGNNWLVHVFSSGDVENLYFLNNLTGWIVGSGGQIWKTVNGGVNWALVRMDEGGSPDYDLLDIYFKDGNTGWASGYNGTLLKSTNGGLNWYNEIFGPLGSIKSLQFYDINSGWLLCNYQYTNDFTYFWRTTNRGYNWQQVSFFENLVLNDFQFVNSQTGYMCGNSGNILATTNGGNNWVSSIVGNYIYKSICFVNSNTGWCCGSGGVIVKTTNSGVDWISQNTGTNYAMNCIKFFNTNMGFIAGDSGMILKTTNGGSNWVLSQPLSNHSYMDVFFLNNTTGWAVGNKTVGGGMNWGTEKVIIKTTNEGINWSTIYSSLSVYQGTGFMSIFFIDSQTGYLATRYDGILKTTNGGANWFTDSSPINEAFNVIYFADSQFGWIGGDRGTLLTTAPPVGISEVGSRIPSSPSLSQNYPNPFNPVTTIKYGIPPFKGARGMMVQLIIYDVLGREIETLVNQSQKPGSYEVQWDGSRYASGVYFYQLSIDNEQLAIKKMVLLK